MTETAVHMMWFLPPASLHKELERMLRQRNTYEIVGALSELCSEYWTLYGDIHTVPPDGDWEAVENKIQSFFKYQAVAKVLKDWGWWDYKYNIPKDWEQEEAYVKDTEGIASRH